MRHKLILALCRVLHHPTQRERHKDGRTIDACPCRRVEDLHWEIIVHQGTFEVSPSAERLISLGDQAGARVAQRLEDNLIRRGKRIRRG